MKQHAKLALTLLFIGSYVILSGSALAAPSGALSANPSPCELDPTTNRCKTEIRWNTSGVTHQYVQIAVNDTGRFVCAAPNQAGSQMTGQWITLYDKRFTLYATDDCSRVNTNAPKLAEIKVHGHYSGTPSGQIWATPTQVQLNPGETAGSTMIQWKSQNVNERAVQVRMNGQLFSCSQSNMDNPSGPTIWQSTSRETGNWITSGNFEFTLHSADDCRSTPKHLLASKAVRGVNVAPNVIIIYLDDLAWKEMPYLNRLKTLLADEGTTFTNFFTPTSLCCPSRSSILRGQYAHNTKVMNNNDRPEWNPELRGGWPAFHEFDEQSTIATWLQGAGVNTFYSGAKYFNQFRPQDIGLPRNWVPPGWNHWHSFGGYLNGSGDAQIQYTTDMIRDQAINFIGAASDSDEPFFMYLTPVAPHLGEETPLDTLPHPAPRHEHAFDGVALPQSPSFNESDISDKVIDTWPVLTEDGNTRGSIEWERLVFENRLESMLAVEDMVEAIIDELTANGMLNRTYIFFASDNGFHQGEHRLVNNKDTHYEEDIRVPLMVRGPGIPKGEVINHMVMNLDIPITILDLLKMAPPDFVDGKSIMPLFGANSPNESDWRNRILIEGKKYVGLRTPRYKFVKVRNWDGKFDRGYELYDLVKDPYELKNLCDQEKTTNCVSSYQEITDFARALKWHLNNLAACTGQDCRDAEML